MPAKNEVINGLFVILSVAAISFIAGRWTAACPTCLDAVAADEKVEAAIRTWTAECLSRRSKQ